jgi:hypothetical protein
LGSVSVAVLGPLDEINVEEERTEGTYWLSLPKAVVRGDGGHGRECQK